MNNFSWKSLASAIATAGAALALTACGGNTPLSQSASASLSAAPASVSSGQASVLSWTSTNATSCTASGAWSGTLATSGTYSTGPLTADTVYSLTCSGQNSTSPVTSATVTIVDAAVPTATLSVSPTTIQTGSAATLTWTSTNATSCTASGAWNGSLASSGSETTGPLTADETYSLVCTGAGGTSEPVTATVTVSSTPVVPTVSLSAAPSAIASGGTSVLSWSSTNATSCTASGGWTGTLATSGTQNTAALTTNTSYSLVCTGPGGSSSTATAAVTIAPLPTAVLTASPTNVASGGKAVLSWSSTNATSCTASGGWSGTLATSGTQSTAALTANTSYSLVCTGLGGTSAPAHATVTVTASAAPTVTLTASPTTIASGGSSTMTWSSTNATTCTASGGAGGWGGTLATSGSFPTGALTSTTTYLLICTGPGGSSNQASVVVTVAPVPTATLTASPTSIASGGASTLTWTSANATSCTASGGWTGPLATTSGSKLIASITAMTTYSIVCSGPGGNSAQVNATVNILPAPTVTLSALPTSVVSGNAATLTWSSTYATSCTASGSWTGPLGVSGTQSTGVLTASQSYQLTCTGTGGTSNTAIANVTVTQPVPTVSLTASPTTVTSGGTSMLSWTSTNTSACTASGSWTGAEPTSGTYTTPALTANASYTLTCTGAGGSDSATAAVSITTGNVVVSPSIAALTLTQQQQFTATLPGGSATWSVDSIPGGNASVGQISSTGLYTTTSGATVGTHTITATSISNPGQSGTATAAVTGLTAVYTYHNDNTRDGVNAQEYALTPSNVKTSFGKITSCAVDGAIYAQPLWVANLQVNGAQHNVVFVATAHDGLFAFDADSNPCTPLWGSNSNLIDTNHGGTPGEVTVPDSQTNDKVSNGYPYGDISPEVGVIGTPVIDQTTNTLYVVSKSMSADGSTFYQRLHAIDITTGNEKSLNANSPILITATYAGSGYKNYPSTNGMVTFSAQKENQRPGLALVNGLVYVAWGSHEDSDPWYGWIMSYQYSNGAFVQKSVLNISPNAGQSGIWLSGGAPAVDSANNLYISSGNGTFDANSTSTPNNDYGDSLMQLTSSLTVTQSFTPQNQAIDNNADRDYGAGGITVLPDLPSGSPVPHLLVTADKLGDIFLLNRDSLGANNPLQPPVQVLSYPLTQPAYPNNNSSERVFFATGAFWNSTYYIASFQGPLYSLTLNPSMPNLTAGATSTHTYGFPGSSPSVSASSSTQNGIVWTLDTGNYCTNQSGGCGPAVLLAHDATNVGTLLWSSPTTSGTGAAGYAVKFTVPTIANGKVYVGTRGTDQGKVYSPGVAPGGELDIFGLTQ